MIVRAFALGILWMALFGYPSWLNFAGGFFLAQAVLKLLERRQVVRKPSDPEFRFRFLALGPLIVKFIGELLTANFRLAKEVLRPEMQLQPAILELPLDARSNFEITVLAIMITLTPGTMSIALSEDRRSLFIHCTHAEDPESVLRSIKQGLEQRLLAVTR